MSSSNRRCLRRHRAVVGSRASIPGPKAEYLLALLERDPLQSPPPFEKLVGDLTGAYSRRINVRHRLVYELLPSERVVKVLRMWTHYE